MKYKQLTREQRYAIYLGLQKGMSYESIAQSIGVSRSTVCREVRRSTIRNRVSIHQRPPEADGKRFGD